MVERYFFNGLFQAVWVVLNHSYSFNVRIFQQFLRYILLTEENRASLRATKKIRSSRGLLRISFLGSLAPICRGLGPSSKSRQ